MAEDKDKKGPKGGKPSAAEIAAKKAAKKASKQSIADDSADQAPSVPAPPPRLIEHYREKVVPTLRQRFGYTNLLAWMRGHGRLGRVGVEGTGAYGAGLARLLRDELVDVIDLKGHYAAFMPSEGTTRLVRQSIQVFMLQP